MSWNASASSRTATFSTDVTVEDPNVWEKPWVIPARTFAFRPEVEFVSEFVCESTVNYQRLFKP